MQRADALALVFQRNYFYRRLYLLAFSALVLAWIVIFTLVGMLTYIMRNPTEPLFFATDTVGRLIQVIPLDKPNMKTEDVMAWTIQAVEDSFSYDFLNYRSQLQSAEKFYTRYGWSNYMTALKTANNLVALQQRKMIALAKVVGEPKIITEGILSGAYAWKFEIPVLVTYQTPPYTPASSFANALDLTVIVQRQSELQSYKGLGVLQVIGRSAGGQSNTPTISDTPTQ